MQWLVVVVVVVLVVVVVVVATFLLAVSAPGSDYVLCRHPYIRDRSGKVLVLSKLDPANYDAVDGIPFPCGQCLPCRINKRRVWTLRLMLESYLHEHSSFITLTYSEDNLPYDQEYRPTLCKRDFQLFLKRLRKRFGHAEVRYYGCGEYGEKSARPHYHAIIFGLSPAELDPAWLLYEGKSGRDFHRHRSSPLFDLWQYGIVHVGECSRQSIQYVAGYVTKKLVVDKKDTRTPEFALMSRRPGIAGGALPYIIGALKDVPESDFSGQLRVDGRRWPMGRYLITRLSESLGFTGNLDEYLNTLSDLYRRSKMSDAVDFLHYVVSLDDQRYKQLDKRDHFFNHRDFEV